MIFLREKWSCIFVLFLAHFGHRIKMLSQLDKDLKQCSDVSEGVAYLNGLPQVTAFPQLEGLSEEEECVLKQWVAIGQHERVAHNLPAIRKILPQLVTVDAFYRELGGLVGYHKKVLSLLRKSFLENEELVFHPPSFFDISEMTQEVREAIAWGIEALAETAEIYPLGGAADRLHLVDDATGEEVPAAKLKLVGRTLFERLIRDLFAREFLYYQMFGKQITTPLAIMTSAEKKNHHHVLQILDENRWFHRPKEMFRLCMQPLVPVLDEEGQWCWSGKEQLLLKPGGHGVLWKLLRDEGVLDWLEERGSRKALIRQINNPAAGLDYGLLAFIGLGWKKGMKFGFASCPRRLLAAEGVNVLIERKSGDLRTLVLTNVEYCDFQKMGIEDKPLRENEPYSRFPSNTNVLFADLASVKEVLDQNSLPGLLLNLKTGVTVNAEGVAVEKKMARLESTMQNLADAFVEEMPLLQKVLGVATGEKNLSTKTTFATYNHRHKTISTAKRAYVPGQTLQETPENCFFEQMVAARELLGLCRFGLPLQRTIEEYLERGPEFVFLYHPALGPLYSIIQEKLQGGSFSEGAELELEISDLWIRGLNVRGSLRILADQVMGHFEGERLCFSPLRGKCVLEEVSVVNCGVDWGASRPVWKGMWQRKESLEIVLHGHSEFVAKGVTFHGHQCFAVEDGTRLIVEQRGREQIMRRESLHAVAENHRA